MIDCQLKMKDVAGERPCIIITDYGKTTSC